MSSWVTVGEISADLENFLLIYQNACFVIAGDFNSLNTDFLCNDFGLCQLVSEATHCNKIIDKVFVSHPDVPATDKVIFPLRDQ